MTSQRRKKFNKGTLVSEKPESVMNSSIYDTILELTLYVFLPCFIQIQKFLEN